MKIILTGSTGFIGSEVLRQCLSHPSITSIVVVSRRNIPITDSKIQLILHDDFSHYPPTLMSALAGAEACIYCLGSNVPVRPPELNRRINFDYALGTAKSFSESLVTQNQEKRFRFVYLSGALPEKDPEKHLWFLAENRRMRGELENALIQLDKDTRDTGFEVHIVRPGFVQAQGATIQNWVIGRLANAIMVHHLAACMVEVALHGYPDVILENETLNALGKAAIARQPDHDRDD